MSRNTLRPGSRSPGVRSSSVEKIVRYRLTPAGEARLREILSEYDGGVEKMEIGNKKDDLTEAMEEGSRCILDPTLRFEERVNAQFRAIVASIRPHESKKAQAAAKIKTAAAAIVAGLRRSDPDLVNKALGDFDREYRLTGLEMPPIEPTPQQRYGDNFLRWGWRGEEIDAAIARMKPSDVVKVDWDRFTIGGRTITREAIRLSLKPRYSSYSDAQWLDRFGPMKRAILVHGDVCFPGGRGTD